MKSHDKKGNHGWKKLATDFRKRLRQKATHVALKDMPSFPLAFNVEMPEGYEHSRTNLSFAIKNFLCEGIEDVKLTSLKKTSYDQLACELVFEQIRVNGSYSIEAKYTPEIDIDTAGNLMVMNANPYSPAEAGSDEATIPTEEQEGYLNEAREQRTRLMDTNNGQKLMGSYNEHNEIYNDAFKNPLMARFWKGDGSTAEMAKDTSSAVKNDNVVNKKNKKYKNGLSYNANAFTQQLNIAVASVMSDPNFNLFKPIEENKYTNAGLSAISFGKSVEKTGNNKRNVTELTSEQVHEVVDDSDEDMPETSVFELQSVIMQGMGDGGAADEAQEGWLILDEEDRLHLRAFITGFMQAKEAAKQYKARPFWEGECQAVINQVRAVVSLDSQNPDQANIRVNLPAFDFEIDDAKWSGKIADIVRKRLEQVYFIRSLIQDQLKNRIEEIIRISAQGIFATS